LLAVRRLPVLLPDDVFNIGPTIASVAWSSRIASITPCGMTRPVVVGDELSEAGTVVGTRLRQHHRPQRFAQPLESFARRLSLGDFGD
jgi:hypothetical protein